MTDPTRPISTQFDEKGPFGTTTFSPTEHKVRAQIIAPPHYVIPIIFVPGIMGSSLKAAQDIKRKEDRQTSLLAKAGAPVWRIDSMSAFAKGWVKKSASERQLLINKDVLTVDTEGKVDDYESSEAASRETIKEIRESSPDLAETLTREIDRFAKIRQDRCKRGWGTISWAFYGEFLQWLEGALKGLAIQNGVPNTALAPLLKMAGKTLDGVVKTPGPLSEEMIKQLLKFHFPVHACGYNWAASNLDSGARLAEEITKVIGGYHNKSGQVCTQVIVITHSMGGLVARAAAMASGAEEKILGVIHGVMPTHGAAAMYKRAALGFGNEADSGLVGWLKGTIAGYSLGDTAEETTPVLAYNPGPLELAPNQLYNGGKPWLFIEDGKGQNIKALPEKGDPYSEIYARTDVWWRAIQPEYLNPAKLPIDGLTEFSKTLASARNYHQKLAENGFHPNTYAHYGADSKHAAWGSLIWHSVSSQIYVPPFLGGGFSFPQRLDDGNKTPVGSSDSWKLSYRRGSMGPILLDGNGKEVSITVKHGADAGDGTVPALASAASVDVHAKVVVRHTNGYEHSDDYNDERVHSVVIDAIVRIVQTV